MREIINVELCREITELAVEKFLGSADADGVIKVDYSTFVIDEGQSFMKTVVVEHGGTAYKVHVWADEDVYDDDKVCRVQRAVINYRPHTDHQTWLVEMLFTAGIACDCKRIHSGSWDEFVLIPRDSVRNPAIEAVELKVILQEL